MQATATPSCPCTHCVGAQCNCGCQAAPQAQPSAPSACACGPNCACQPETCRCV